MTTPAWEELVATALLGTERRPPQRPAPPGDGDGALAHALGGLAWDDAEGALLGAAGLLTGYRAAGWRAPMLAEQPSSAPADPRPLCSAGADAILARLLDLGPAALLGPWLDLARRAGVRPAPELHPALLDAALADRDLRPGVLDAGGDRLRWLAAQDERWSWAAGAAPAGADVEQRWRTGTVDERLVLLRDARASDPDRGRELLASTWTQDSAAQRALLLAGLETGLAPGDEPFLEAALDDRAKTVRRQAAQMLASLPTSALARRMAQRLRELAGVGARPRRRLAVRTPGEPDDATRRDGIDDDGKPAQLGLGAWRLAQIVAAAPLGFWLELTGEEPAKTVALARGSDHEAALLLGWGAAAVRQRDAAWAAAVARESGDLELLSVVPAGAGDELALGLLAGAPDAPVLLDLLDRIAAPWSPAVSRAAIAHLARVLALPGQLWTLRLVEAALAIDLDARDDVIAAVQRLQQTDPQPFVRRALDELLTILDLRHAMTRELTPT